MGICSLTAMANRVLVLGLATVLFLGCFEVECRSLDGAHSMIKRGLRDPNDPRNLFNSIYGINYKRGYAEPFRNENDMSDLYALYADQAYSKRGLRDPNDPRNLFRAIYGYKK